MSGILVPSNPVLEAARALSASRPDGRALLLGSGEYIDRMRTEFASVVVSETDNLDPEHGYDLIVVAEGLETGTLWDALGRLARFKSQLMTGGLGIFTIRPMAHPLQVDDGPTPVGHFDALLFPYAARMGDLGGTARHRLMLSPLSWLYMFERVGFSLMETCDAKPDGRVEDLRRTHGARLVHFDEEALSSSAVTFLVSADGGSQ